ncbi:MAG: hypothetical protein CSA32_05680 [Desulfobulbus propionicus]|nr:MAG: hypothetical protein CSA32_05680 [Desulfobulbus propionicus]
MKLLNKLAGGGLPLVATMFIVTAATGAAGPEKTQGRDYDNQTYQSFGDTEILEKKPVNCMFRHSEHVVANQITCDACHLDIFVKKRGAARKKGDYTMASFNEGKYCGSCHDGEHAFSTADSENCFSCHRSEDVEIKALAHLYEPVIFPHAMHTEIAECQQCHHHTLGQEPLELRCARCHEQDQPAQSVSCQYCHSAEPFSAEHVHKRMERDLYHIDKPGLKGAFHLNCIGCHEEEGGPTECQACHAFTQKGEQLFHVEDEAVKSASHSDKEKHANQGGHQ